MVEFKDFIVMEKPFQKHLQAIVRAPSPQVGGTQRESEKENERESERERERGKKRERKEKNGVSSAIT